MLNETKNVGCVAPVPGKGNDFFGFLSAETKFALKKCRTGLFTP